MIKYPLSLQYSYKKGISFMEVEPIKDLKKIQAMKVLLRSANLRDEAMFVLGINTALRISDLLALKVGDVLGEKRKIPDTVEIQEQKTGKIKQFQLNKSVKETLSNYLKTRLNATPNDPLFPSRNGGGPLCRWRARRILHEVGEAVGLDKIGTHSLRKTFGYHVYRKTGGNLGLVQKLLNHATSGDTLRYIGIDKEEMDATYMDLNL
jgi:integrase